MKEWVELSREVAQLLSILIAPAMPWLYRLNRQLEKHFPCLR